MRALAEVRTVGVVGAGTMGSGIATVFAAAGYDVRLADVSADLVTAGRDRVEDSLARSERSAADREAALARVAGTTDLSSFADADFVVEAVVEDLDVKREVFETLSTVTDDGVVLATNTSTLSVTRLGAATDRPGQVVGLHFMNPAPVMVGVEVVVGEETEESTVALCHALAADLDKETWEADDRPGFVVNRVLMPWLNEGIRAYDEGVAAKADVDRALELGTNVPMGPLELADHVGLDVVLDASETLHAELGERYRPAYLLRRKVAAGHLGTKTGRGFYEYD